MLKDWKNITQEELDLMAKHKKMMYYNSLDSEELINLIKDWVDENANLCSKCGSTSLRQYKSKLMNLYCLNKIEAQNNINEKKIINSNKNEEKQDNNNKNKNKKK